MIIQRERYLQCLIKKRGNGLIKIISGIRRCGKSFLLFNLFYHYLIEDSVNADHIITLSLEELGNAKFRNPFLLDEEVRSRILDDKQYYLFIDEVQNVTPTPNPWGAGSELTFVDVLLGLMKIVNLDIYITGSNSKFLSSDIVTQFRDRGDELYLAPLSASEFSLSCPEMDWNTIWKEYYSYGGLPRIITYATHADKARYLLSLFKSTYKKDIVERNSIRNNDEILDDLIQIVASNIGSLTNPLKIANTFKTNKGVLINSTTIASYLQYFEDAFLIRKVNRFDIKGRKYIKAQYKYYFTDMGLRNAILNFRQLEENHIMENIVFNELIIRGFSVDIGVVEYRYKTKENKEIRSQLEVDFIATKIQKNYYIQVAQNIDSKEKREQESNSLKRIPNSFKKLVIVGQDIQNWTDEDGILYIGIKDFLQIEQSIDF